MGYRSFDKQVTDSSSELAEFQDKGEKNKTTSQSIGTSNNNNTCDEQIEAAIAKMDANEEKTDKKNGNTRENSLEIAWISVVAMMKIWKKKDFLIYLLCLTVFSGTTFEFITGVFPLFIKDKAFKFYVFSIYGLISAIFSYAFGKLSDNATIGGRVLVLKICCTAHCLFYCLCLFLVYNDNFYQYKNDVNHWLFFIIVAIIVGIGDGGLISQIPALYPCIIGKVRFFEFISI